MCSVRVQDLGPERRESTLRYLHDVGLNQRPIHIFPQTNNPAGRGATVITNMQSRFVGSPITPLQPDDRLQPDDLADLRRSNLSDDMIAAMGCFSIEASEIEKLTGVKVASSGYAMTKFTIGCGTTVLPFMPIRGR
jgi:hypothetical protein